MVLVQDVIFSLFFPVISVALSAKELRIAHYFLTIFCKFMCVCHRCFLIALSFKAMPTFQKLNIFTNLSNNFFMVIDKKTVKRHLLGNLILNPAARSIL